MPSTDKVTPNGPPPEVVPVGGSGGNWLTKRFEFGSNLIAFLTAIAAIVTILSLFYYTLHEEIVDLKHELKRNMAVMRPEDAKFRSSLMVLQEILWRDFCSSCQKKGGVVNRNEKTCDFVDQNPERCPFFDYEKDPFAALE